MQSPFKPASAAAPITSPKNVPKWKNIRYEEISDGFVSTTSSNTALFCRTLASFGPQPPPPTIITTPNNNNNNPTLQQQQPEVWSRFRFGLSPTVAVASFKLYGEGAVVGVEISHNATTNHNHPTSPLLLHALLRCDGTLVLKKATSDAGAGMEDSQWNFKTNPVPPPSIVLIRGGGATEVVSSATSSDDPSFSSSNFQLFRCPPCCIFTPGSTVLVRSSFSFSTCIVIEWLIFCSSSADLVMATTTTTNGCGGKTTNNNNLAILVTQTIPIAFDSKFMSQFATIESAFNIETVAGQSANLCLPGSRKPDLESIRNRQRQQQQQGGGGDDSTTSPTAEFVADFVAVNSRNFILRAPSLMLSGACYNGAPNTVIGGCATTTATTTTTTTDSDSESLSSSVNSVSAATGGGSMMMMPTSPSRHHHHHHAGGGGGSFESSLRGEEEVSTTMMMMRLAATGSSRQQLKFNSLPSYVNLRAESSMKRMEAIVDSL